MASFADFLIAADRNEVVLVELTPRFTLGGFTVVGGNPHTYSLTMLRFVATTSVTGGLYRRVVGVRENSTDLTAQTSIATVDANASSWWWDEANEILYVHSSTGANPDTFSAYQAHVRFYVASRAIVLDETDGDPGTGLFYQPWLLGELPALTERDDEAIFGAKITAGGVLRLANGHGAWHAIVAHNGAYHWTNAPICALFGGSYAADTQTLTRAQYREIFTVEVEDITSDEEALEAEIKPLVRRTTGQIPKTPFFASSFPNAGDGVIGTKKWIGYGRTTMRPDLTDTSGNGVYTVADSAFQDLRAVHSVTAIRVDTGATTRLTLTTDYTVNLTACTITIVNATFIHTAYLIECDVTGKNDTARGVAIDTFGAIVRDLITTHLGFAQADLDVAVFGAGGAAALPIDTDAPEPHSLWIKSARTIASILATAAEDFASMERGVLGLVFQTLDGKWTADIWDPNFNPTGLDVFRKEEFAVFKPQPKLESGFSIVNCHYNYNHSTQQWAIEQASDTRLQHLLATTDRLDLYTFLRDSGDAQRLAQRQLFMAGGIGLQVEFEERGVRLATARPRTRVIVNYTPGPDSTGGFVDRVFEVTELTRSFLPTLQVNGVLGDMRGIGEHIGQWTAAGAPNWDSSTDAAKAFSGYWADASGFVDPADAATKDISRWY